MNGLVRFVDGHRVTEDAAATASPIETLRARCGCKLAATPAFTNVAGVAVLMFGVTASCDDHADVTPEILEGLVDWIGEQEGEITIAAALASYAERLP